MNRKNLSRGGAEFAEGECSRYNKIPDKGLINFPLFLYYKKEISVNKC